MAFEPIGIVPIVNKPMRQLLANLGRPVVPELAKTMLKAAHIAAEQLGIAAPKDTAQLARSFSAGVSFVEKSPTNVRTQAVSNLPYAAIHARDEETTIFPKKSALAIPLKSSPEAQASWPRDWAKDKLFVLVTKGKAFLVEDVGKKKVKFHYILLKSVTIRGNGYLKIAKKKSKPLIMAMVDDKVAELAEALSKRPLRSS